MTDLTTARRLALSLPETTEAEHHDMGSFRVRGKIFATVPDERHLRIMLPPEEIEAAVARDPQACSPLFWGERLACLVVEFGRTSTQELEDLLVEAWAGKAPKRVAAAFLGTGTGQGSDEGGTQ